MGYLARVDAGSGRAVWERARHGHVVARGEKVLLCAESKRRPVDGGGYAVFDDQKYVQSPFSKKSPHSRR